MSSHPQQPGKVDKFSSKLIYLKREEQVKLTFSKAKGHNGTNRGQQINVSL